MAYSRRVKLPAVRPVPKAYSLVVVLGARALQQVLPRWNSSPTFCLQLCSGLGAELGDPRFREAGPARLYDGERVCPPRPIGRWRNARSGAQPPGRPWQPGGPRHPAHTRDHRAASHPGTGAACPTRLRRAPRHKVLPGWAVQCGGCDWLGEPHTWPTTTTRIADPGRGAACQGTRAPSPRGSGTTCVRSLSGRWALVGRFVRAPDAISKRRYVAGRGFSCKVEHPRLAQVGGDAAMRSYGPGDRVQRPPRSRRGDNVNIIEEGGQLFMRLERSRSPNQRIVLSQCEQGWRKRIPLFWRTSRRRPASSHQQYVDGCP